MHCPACHATDDNEVVDSRLTAHGTAIRRRRGCLACGARFTTYEVASAGPPTRGTVLAAQLDALAAELRRCVVVSEPPAEPGSETVSGTSPTKLRMAKAALD